MIANYHVKKFVRNSQQSKQTLLMMLKKIVHCGILFHILSWKQKKHKCLLWLLKMFLKPVWVQVLKTSLMITENFWRIFWRDNWRSIISAVETSAYVDKLGMILFWDNFRWTDLRSLRLLLLLLVVKVWRTRWWIACRIRAVQVIFDKIDALFFSIKVHVF